MEERTNQNDAQKRLDAYLEAIKMLMDTESDPRLEDRKTRMLERLNARIDAEEFRHHRAGRILRIVALAASFVLVVALGWWGAESLNRQPQLQSWENTALDVSQITLPDGTSVCLKSGASLTFEESDGCRIAAGILFILASFTDYLDGHIARKHNLITDFGKFIDPVADKLLVLTSLIMMLHLGLMEAWIIIVILCRDLAVDGLRLVAVTQGKVIAASKFGKLKTVSQMVLITVSLLLNLSCFSAWYMIVLSVLAVLLTLLSAVDYFVRNRSVFQTM